MQKMIKKEMYIVIHVINHPLGYHYVKLIILSL